MKKNIRFMAAIAMFALTLCTGCSKTQFSSKKAVKDSGKVAFNDVNGFDLVLDMQNGWNLGNTMDAIGSGGLNSETSWSQPKTTKAMIEGLAASGIKTIRIPTSWAKHIVDKNYTIDPEWMARVKEIVDWAIGADMYVILNTHHDNWDSPEAMNGIKGYYPNTENLEESKRFIENVWAQISLAFNNGYDEKLIFETMNEPRLRGTANEWWNDKNSSEYYDASDCLNELNQLALNTIRKSGGNNKKRFVMIPALCASVDSALTDEFKMPDDLAEFGEDPHLILSVHMYSPYDFAMGTPGGKAFTNRHKIELASTFNKLEDKMVRYGYPVVIGEYGATNKGNLEDRIAWFEYFNTTARSHGYTAVLWDNGQYDPNENEGERFGFYNRNNQSWYFPEILEAIVESTKLQ